MFSGHTGLWEVPSQLVRHSTQTSRKAGCEGDQAKPQPPKEDRALELMVPTISLAEPDFTILEPET